jgi:hypothetical protein
MLLLPEDDYTDGSRNMQQTFVIQILVQTVGNKVVYMRQFRGRCTVLVHTQHKLPSRTPWKYIGLALAGVE